MSETELPTAGAAAPLLDEAGEEMVMDLELDQLVESTSRPLPRARLGRRALVGLWALRVFVVVVGAMVIYTFVTRLH